MIVLKIAKVVKHSECIYSSAHPYTCPGLFFPTTAVIGWLKFPMLYVGVFMSVLD